jgi:hypothetical protein
VREKEKISSVAFKVAADMNRYYYMHRRQIARETDRREEEKISSVAFSSWLQQIDPFHSNELA